MIEWTRLLKKTNKAFITTHTYITFNPFQKPRLTFNFFFQNLQTIVSCWQAGMIISVCNAVVGVFCLLYLIISLINRIEIFNVELLIHLIVSLIPHFMCERVHLK